MFVLDIPEVDIRGEDPDGFEGVKVNMYIHKPPPSSCLCFLISVVSFICY